LGADLNRSESTGWPEKAPTDSRCSMQFHKPQRQPIAAVSPFVTHVTRKAMHQVDSEIADFRLLERLCHRWGRELGRIEFPAAILNAGDQRSCIALQLDRNPQAVVLAPPPCIMMLATASSRQS